MSLLRSQRIAVRWKAIYSSLCFLFGPYFPIEHKVSAAQIAFRKMNLTKNHTLHSFNKHLFVNASHSSETLIVQGTYKWTRKRFCLRELQWVPWCSACVPYSKTEDKHYGRCCWHSLLTALSWLLSGLAHSFRKTSVQGHAHFSRVWKSICLTLTWRSLKGHLNSNAAHKNVGDFYCNWIDPQPSFFPCLSCLVHSPSLYQQLLIL